MNRSIASALLLVLATLLGAPVPARAQDLITVTGLDDDFSPVQRAKLTEALALANRVVASPGFRARLEQITGFNYSRADGATVYRDLLARTYALRFEGVEQYAFRFGRIRRVSKMVASTGHGSGQITFNVLRMHEFPASYYAGTIVHELTHICTDSTSGTGYRHRGNNPTTANQRSVPYVVGELVRELAEALEAEELEAEEPSGPTPGITGALEEGAVPATPPARR